MFVIDSLLLLLFSDLGLPPTVIFRAPPVVCFCNENLDLYNLQGLLSWSSLPENPRCTPTETRSGRIVVLTHTVIGNITQNLKHRKTTKISDTTNGEPTSRSHGQDLQDVYNHTFFPRCANLRNHPSALIYSWRLLATNSLVFQPQYKGQLCPTVNSANYPDGADRLRQTETLPDYFDTKGAGLR